MFEAPFGWVRRRTCEAVQAGVQDALEAMPPALAAVLTPALPAPAAEGDETPKRRGK